VDQGLDSAAKLLSLGRSLSRLPARNVTLLTLPTVPDPAAPGRLLPEEPQDDVIFQMILGGQSWRQQLPVQPDGQVSVRVLNGTGTTGLAGPVAARLRRLGFRVIGTGDAPATSTSTVTYSGTAQADSAWTLTAALSGDPAAQDLRAEPGPQEGTPGPVTLVIGADFAGVRGPAAPRASASALAGPAPVAGPVQVRNAAASICSGLPAANPDPGQP
jgi:LytR cell envelope-related transcriptional attenuator